MWRMNGMSSTVRQLLLAAFLWLTACAPVHVPKAEVPRFMPIPGTVPDYVEDVYTLLAPGPSVGSSSVEEREKLERSKIKLAGYKTTQGWRYTYTPVAPSPLFCAVVSSYLTEEWLRQNFVIYAHVTNLCSQLYRPSAVVTAFEKRFETSDTEYLKRWPGSSYFRTFFRRKSLVELDFENAIVMAKFIADHFKAEDDGGFFRSGNILLGKGALMRFGLCLSEEDVVDEP